MGVGSAHAQANAIQLETLLSGKVLEFKKGIFHVNLARMAPSLQPLLESLRQIERGGDYAAAQKLVQDKARVLSNIQRRLISLDTVPVDVAFDYKDP
jgi:23S rRNA A2030 N6-methylase RlmJ